MKPVFLLLWAMILFSPKANSEDVKLLWEHSPMQSLNMTGNGKYLYEQNNSIIINTETSAVTQSDFGKLPERYKSFSGNEFQYYNDTTMQITIYDLENNSVSYEDVSYIKDLGKLSVLDYSQNYIIINIYDGYKALVIDRKTKSVVHSYTFDQWKFPRFAMISANENLFFLIYEEQMMSYNMQTGEKYCTVDASAYGVRVGYPQRKFCPNDTTLILFNYHKFKIIDPKTNVIRYSATDASTVFENISTIPNCDTLLKYGAKNYVYIFNLNTAKVSAYKSKADTIMNVSMNGDSFFEYYIDSNKIIKRDLVADTSVILFQQSDKKCNRYWDNSSKIFSYPSVSSDKYSTFVTSNNSYLYVTDYESGNVIESRYKYSINEINENEFWFLQDSRNKLMKYDFKTKKITDSTNAPKYKLLHDNFINSKYAITKQVNSINQIAYIEDLENGKIIDSLIIDQDPAHTNNIPNSVWGIEVFDLKNNSALKKFSLLPMIYDAELYILPSMEKKYTWQFNQVYISEVAPNNKSMAFVYKNNPKAVVFHNLETNIDDTLYTDISIRKLIYSQNSQLLLLQDSALSTVAVYRLEDRKELANLKFEGNVYPSNNFEYMIVDSKIRTHISCYQIDSFKKSTAVEDIINDVAVSIYPNPCSEKLMILNDEKENINSVEIYNALGERMQSQNCNTDKFVNLNISDLMVGTYYIKLNYSNRSIIKSFVKN